MTRYNEFLRPVWAEIDLAAFRHNISEVKRLVGPAVEVMAVVKAEAYGHGAVMAAQSALKAGASWFGVALPEEGIALRQAGLQTPTLIFGPLQVHQAEAVVKYNLTSTACLPEAVATLSHEAVKTRKTALVHVKVDTGMGRVGVKPAETVDFIRYINNLPSIKVTGIFSHLATADERNKAYAEKQIKIFTDLINTLKELDLQPEKIHLANSAAIIDLPSAYFNMVRPGIMIYGLYPSREVSRDKVELKPVLSLKTKINFAKRVPQDTGVSYGQRYHTARETTIASIPIGYADGWTRMLTHKAHALVGGKRFPVVGTICMDHCMIDVGDEPVTVGQEVVLIGRQGRELIHADDLAEALGTINYEITCMCGDRVPRIYINEHV